MTENTNGKWNQLSKPINKVGVEFLKIRDPNVVDKVHPLNVHLSLEHMKDLYGPQKDPLTSVN
jgi:hypothetical protein